MSHTNKKIIIITSYPIFNEPVVYNRVVAFLNVLKERGWQVHLVTIKDEMVQEKSIDGINIHFVEVPTYKKNGFLKRGVFEVYCSLKLLKKARTIDAHYSLITIPSMFLLFSSLYTVSNIQIIDVRDLVWEYLSEKSPISKFIKYGVRFFAQKMMGRADILTCTNTSEQTHLKLLYPNKDIHLLSNGISKTQFEKLSTIKSKKDNKLFTVTYVGNVGVAQNLSCIVEALANKDNIRLQIIGFGNDFEKVKNKVNELEAKNIFMTGRIPWDEVAGYYENSDILYTQLTSEFKTAVPSKLYEYLATGLPVAYGGYGTALEVLSKFENVNTFSPNSPKDILQSVNGIREAKLAISTKNIEIIKQSYIRETFFENFLNKLES